MGANMLNELGRLNELFFRLYGEVYENTELLSKKQADYMMERLFEQYKSEYLKLFIEKDIDDKQALFVLKKRRKGYVPFSFLFWKNKAFKLFRSQITKELDEYFNYKFEELEKAKQSFNLENPEENIEDVTEEQLLEEDVVEEDPLEIEEITE